MTYDYGLEALKLADKGDLQFDIYYADDDPSSDDPAYSGNDSRLAWAEATACDSATVYFEADDSFISLVHGNDPDETISNHSSTGIAALICAQVLGGVRA